MHFVINMMHYMLNGFATKRELFRDGLQKADCKKRVLSTTKHCSRLDVETGSSTY